MKKLFALCSVLCALCAGVSARAAATENFLSCGDGFILVDGPAVNGIATAACQKLWCQDLETGKPMGSGDRANSGYRATSAPVELCDADNTCIQCFGDRNWCNGEIQGVWNPQYGAYTKKGDDSNAFLAQQRGSCFGWSIQKPQCAGGETAVMQNNKWVCASSTATATAASRASAVRRGGTVRSVFPAPGGDGSTSVGGAPAVPVPVQTATMPAAAALPIQVIHIKR